MIGSQQYLSGQLAQLGALSVRRQTQIVGDRQLYRALTQPLANIIEAAFAHIDRDSRAGLLHPSHDLWQAIGRQVFKTPDHQLSDTLSRIGIDLGKGPSLAENAAGLDHDGTPERGQRYAEATLAHENRLAQHLFQFGDGRRNGGL
ncbi:hypothetical protein D3C75_771920 [compost metagenome]